MSWSGGPIAGAGLFQPQPYGNSQPAYGQQQPYQYGQQPAYGQYQAGPPYPQPGPPQRPPDNRPPKKKGNPIITRYPPPPGYRGPAQPQGPFGANQYPTQYQPPQPGYSQAPLVPPTYPQHGYTAFPANQGYPPPGYGQPQAPNHSQPSYPQGQNYQWPQQGYPPNQGYSQPQMHSAVQGYPPPQTQSNYPGYSPQPAPTGPNQQHFSQPQTWSSQAEPPPYPPNTQYNSHGGPPVNAPPITDPNATPTPAVAPLATSQNAPPANQPTSAVSENESSDKPQLFLAWDDWDFDFDGAIWPKSNEPVDPNLSLGVIIWHPAKQMTRALPSTFAEAEEQTLRPTPEKLDNGESVSMYFMAENSHEAFLDVRQTDEWEQIRDDPIFVVFTDEEMHHNLVSLEDCIAQRDRSDQLPEGTSRDEDQEMHDAAWDIMDNLEQALSSSNGNSKPSGLKKDAASSPERSQEDILAMLGVTGAPKPPSDEPMPVSFPSHKEEPSASLPEKPRAISSSLIRPSSPPPQRAQSFGGHRNPGCSAPPRPFGSMSSSSNSRPPPPPPPPEDQRYDPWNAPQRNGHGLDGSRGSPALSEGSNRTMAGSDFDSEKPSHGTGQEPTVIPPLKRSDSSFARKRSYEDTDHDNERSQQQDDNTKRKRRAQIDAAYR
ncbi:Nn.00g115870.m01.CDS01 [Neocucurbitaria sp. VM-36]